MSLQHVILSLATALAVATTQAAESTAPRTATQSEAFVPGRFRSAVAAQDSAPPQAFKAKKSVSVREVVLNPARPSDPSTRIQLISVGRDQTTVIRTGSGQILVGKPGDYFKVPGSGASGLQLLAVSPDQGEALFEQRKVEGTWGNRFADGWKQVFAGRSQGSTRQSVGSQAVSVDAKQTEIE